MRKVVARVTSIGIGVIAWSALLGLATPASAQLTSEDIAALRERGQREGWTFTVDENPATARPLENLCGMVVPDRWWEGARFDPCRPRRDLPESFDWRELGGCTPVRDQESCGSCWAFATTGALECNILIVDGVERDLAEQWLVSCNSDGWGCNGGWWAHDYHWWKTDPCDGVGALLEKSFPYTAHDDPCECPYEHRYLISGWSFIDGYGMPDVDAIKQAILDYGPVSVSVYVDGAFQAYDGGIFNECTDDQTNHAVVLVGWDNAEGGYWIMRNSWGSWWGEDGYMRILYECSRIGYAACYVNYQGTPPEIMFEYPDGRPELSGHNGSSFRVDVLHDSGTPVPDTGVLYWSLDGNTYEASPMTLIDSGPYADHYEAHLPAASCLDTLYWYVGAEEVTEGMQYNPKDAPESVYSVLVADAIDVILDDPFEIDHGWTVVPGAEVGNWERANPEGTYLNPWGTIQPENDHTVFGSKCYVTGPEAGGWAGSYDVEGGPTHLISPLLDLEQKWATVSYWRWYHISGQKDDELVVAVSNDDGDTWVPVETVNHREEWTFVKWNLSDYVTPTAQVRIRFTAEDTENNSLVEALIDDLTIEAIFCTSDYEVGDVNCDGEVNFEDINPFVLALSDPQTYELLYPDCPFENRDINADGNFNFEDINPFVALFGE